jgi:hypothetical protein
MTLLRRIRQLFLGWLEPAEFNRVVRVGELYHVPDQLDRRTVYVAGSVDHPKWAVFLCPCEHPHRIALSLQPSHPKRWRVVEEQAGPTIHPSIDALDWKRCHFWISKGRVRWVPAWQDAQRAFDQAS